MPVSEDCTPKIRASKLILFIMPINKYYDFRIEILDRCFSDFVNKYTFKDLLDVVNLNLHKKLWPEISARTLRYDINLIRDKLPYNVKLETYPIGGKLCYYRYSKEGFSIYKNELSPQDIESLRSTIDMLGKYRNLPSNRWLEDVVSKLEIRFGIRAQAENLVSFSHNEDLKGIEYLSDLITAVTEHHTLEIIYRPSEGKEYQHILHPYFLKQYNERWFLFGLDDKEQRIKNLALDRIGKFKKSGTPFIKNTFIDFSSYFNNIIGVTIPQEQEIVEIKLKFSKKRFNYVTSKKIHKSQETISTEECIISLKVIPTKELDQQIFSFGPDVEVISPAWYREEFSKKIEESMKKYLSVQYPCTDKT